MLSSFPLAFFVIRTIKETNYGDEEMVFVDDGATAKHPEHPTPSPEQEKMSVM
jgi:hypothetical protein